MQAVINSTLIKTLPEGKDADIYDSRLAGFVLRLRKSGKHSYRVRYDGNKWYTLGRLAALTPAEAREQAIKILGDVAKGNDPGAAKKRARAATLRDYLKTVYGPWVTTHRKDGKATLARLERNFNPDLGGKPLPEITPWLVEKWRSKRTKAGKAPSTINRDVITLKAALNRAVEWNIIEANPIAKVKAAKMDRKGVVRYLSDAEETRLRDALIERDERMRAERISANQWRYARHYPIWPVPTGYMDHTPPLVLIAINTGMRRGELFNLRWQDVDLDRAMLTVEGGGAKSGQTRHIPLNTEAVDVLRTWTEAVDVLRTWGEAEGLVFSGAKGARLDNIQKSWLGIVKAAKLTAFRFHDLRHTFASKLVMAGVDLNTVRELLGHGDLTMTLRYAHLAPEHKAEAVARLMAPKAKVGVA